MRKPFSSGLGLLAPVAAVAAVTLSCGDPSSATPPLLTDAPTLPHVTSESDVRIVLDAVRRDLYPELGGVTIVVEVDDGTVFFASNVALDTLRAAPRERTYRVQVGRDLFRDPPSNRAVYAILAHEVKHTLDYVGMDEKALVEFAVDYALKPQTDYERATDRHALDLGVGRGLADYRRWLYAHVADPDVRAEKLRDYYSPDEIAAYLTEHPAPDRLP
jgi:hypothetical protein